MNTPRSNRASVAAGLTLAVAAGLMATVLSAQTSPRPGAVRRTPWGDPDLQGVWNSATATPLERPNGLGNKDVLSDEEAAEFQAAASAELNHDRRDGPPEEDVARSYNDHWNDARHTKITADHRTSLIVDPPDGRIPPLVALSPERQKAREERAAIDARFRAGMPLSVTGLSLTTRCIMRTDQPPYLPVIYNSNAQIFQGPGYVAIAVEMIHSSRIIPLDGRPHLEKEVTQWLGDARGHWEGSTLVVETTNYKREPRAIYPGPVFRSAVPAPTVVERFTRTSADTLEYEFTVTDPTTWTRPFTARMPWTKIDPLEQIYEYACHEDNFDLAHFLIGARTREQRGETFPARK